MSSSSSSYKLWLLAGSIILSTTTTQAQNIASVNGVAIPSSRLEALVKEATARGKSDTPSLREELKESLINWEVLNQESIRRQINKDTKVLETIELYRQRVMINALFEDMANKNPISDKDIQAEYDKHKEQSTGSEYNAKHILVKTENEAKKIIASLKKGGKFQDLAKQSLDPGSKAKGGELGWSAPDAYVPPFAAALSKLEKGQFTQEPVKTDFGWHVIMLENVRPAQFPNLEQVRPQIVNALRGQRIDELVTELRKKAKVE